MEVLLDILSCRMVPFASMSQGNLKDWSTGWVPTQRVFARHRADLLPRCCPPTGDQQPGRTGVTNVSLIAKATQGLCLLDTS